MKANSTEPCGPLVNLPSSSSCRLCVKESYWGCATCRQMAYDWSLTKIGSVCPATDCNASKIHKNGRQPGGCAHRQRLMLGLGMKTYIHFDRLPLLHEHSPEAKAGNNADDLKALVQAAPAKEPDTGHS